MRHFAAHSEFCRNRKCRTHRYARRKGSACTTNPYPVFGPTNKTSQRDCPRCKWAEPSLLRSPRRAMPPCKAQPLAGSSGCLNFRFLSERRSQFNQRHARIAKLRATIHAFDYELNLVNWFGVLPDADEVRIFESLIGNVLRKCVFVIQRDLELRDAIVFQPWFLLIVLVITRLDQEPIERKRPFHVEGYILADAIPLDSLCPRRCNLSGRIALYVNDVIIVFALGCQRRACRRIVVSVIEKVLVFPENIRCAATKIFFGIAGRILVVF